MSEEREVINVDADTACDMAFGDAEGFEVVSGELVDTSRWTASFEVIVKRTKDSKFFRSYYSKGLTEYQDHSPYEYDEPKFEQVFPVEKTIIVYE